MTKAAPLIVYGVGALGILIWGASPAATKLAVESFDALNVGILRVILAAALILPFAISQKLPLPASKHDWWILAAAALVGSATYSVLFTIGISKTSTIHAALIIASAPIFTGLIGFGFDKNWPRVLWWGGAAVAFLGEILLITSKDSGPVQSSWQGDLFILTSIICVSVGYVAGGKLSTTIGSWAATSWSLVISGLVLVPLFINMGLSNDWASVSPVSWWALGYLVVFISILGYVCWYWAIGQMGVGPIAPLQFALPIVSITLGVLIFDEALTWEVITATVIILSGIMITRKALK